MSKKIVYIYLPKGLLYYNLVKHFKKESFESYWFTNEKNFKVENEFNFKAIEFKPFLQFNFLKVALAFYKGIFKSLKRIRPDVIVATDLNFPSFWQAFFYKLLNPRVKLILYSEIQRYPKNIFLKFSTYLLIKILSFFDNVESIFTFTEYGKSFYKKHFPNKKIEVFPPGINSQLFYPSKKKLFLKNRCLKILINSRYSDYKRYEDLLNALSYLKKAKLDFKFELSILATRGDESYRSFVKKLINELNLKNEVKFLEKVEIEKMRQYNLDHDLLILPSYNEAIGMVIPEAMACGIPTITSDTVGANVYVVKGKTGLIFKTGNFKDLAKKIYFLYDKNKLKTFGGAASMHIINNFTIEKTNQTLKRKLNYFLK